MKRRRTPAELDRLLARGGLGPARHDAILEAVLDQVKSERPARTWRRWSLLGLGLAAAATAVLLVPRHRPQPPGDEAFRAKGESASAPSAPPALRIECLGASLEACPSGSLLAIHVRGVRGFVSAWAEPEGGGERIWYHSAETDSPLVDGLAAGGASANRAVKIGPGHGARGYHVEIRVTERPLDREALLRLLPGGALASAQARLVVTMP